MPRGGHPLDFGFMLQADGRWNRYGEYGCLYTALSREGAIAEYRKALGAAGLTPEQDAARDLASIEVDVDGVLNVADTRTRRRLDLDAAMLFGDDDVALEYCRTLADYARSEGYNAIISPSAAAKRQRNLTIYLDARPHEMHLQVGEVRVRLNY